MYNSTRYDVIGRAIIIRQVAGHEKTGIETGNAQNKLEIKILLTVKSLLSLIRFPICLGASELTMKIYRATKHYKLDLETVRDQPPLRPLLKRSCQSLCKRSLFHSCHSPEADGFSPREFALMSLVLEIRNDCI